MLKDCLIFNIQEKGKIVIPRSVIKGLKTESKRNWSTSAIEEVTIILVDTEFAENMGINLFHHNRYLKVVPIEVTDDLLKVMGMIGASTASEILFK